MEATSTNNRIRAIDMIKQHTNMDGHVARESEDDERNIGGGGIDEDKRKRAAAAALGGGGASSKRGSIVGGGGGGGSSMKMCQAENCSVDLSDAKAYHRRHKVCEHHAKEQVVVVAGIRQRFCQQCSSADFMSCWSSMNRKEVAEGAWRVTMKGGVETRPTIRSNNSGHIIDNDGSAPAAAPSLLSSS